MASGDSRTTMRQGHKRNSDVGLSLSGRLARAVPAVCDIVPRYGGHMQREDRPWILVGRGYHSRNWAIYLGRFFAWCLAAWATGAAIRHVSRVRGG